MEEELLGLIEKVLELMENDECKSYVYTKNRLHIIDKEENIDFEAKLSNNNYYFKDNINNNMYIFVKKYLNNNTTVQKILMDNGEEQFYYSFLERDTYLKMARLIRKQGNEYLICDNSDLMNKTDKQLLQYADQNLSAQGNIGEGEPETPNRDETRKFIMELQHAQEYFDMHNSDEDYSDIDDIDDYESYENEDGDSYELDEDEFSALFDEEFDEDFNEEYDEEYDENDEFLDGDLIQDEPNAISAAFENKTIAEYKNEIDEQVKQSASKSQTDQKEDLNILIDYYRPYKLMINGRPVEGRAKILMAGECDVIVEEKYFESVMMNEGASNLKMTIDAVQKFLEENQELDK